MSDDDHWMGVALEEADAAAAHGDVPVGCVIIRGGKALARGRNRREVDDDPTAHAEVLALRAGGRALEHWRLEDCTVYVTLEPCPMCAGALVNARVSRVVFGAHDPKAGAVASLYSIGQDERLNHRFEVSAGVRADECAARLKAFFARLRAEGQK